MTGYGGQPPYPPYQPQPPQPTASRRFVELFTSLPALLTAIATLITALAAVGYLRSPDSSAGGRETGEPETPTRHVGDAGGDDDRDRDDGRRTASPSTTAPAATDPRVELVVRADPSSEAAACPVTVRFTGRISVTRSDGPVDVAYRWVRSDGASAPVETVRFERPGSRDVETTWQRGGSVGDVVDGWQQLEVTAPVEERSERAAFALTCA